MIYLDHNATTNLHPAVKSKMDDCALLPLNPSSVHSNGRKGKSLLEGARRSIARLLGIESSFKNYQITFTASGTEANNIILANYKEGEIFISAVEHTSIFAYSRLFPNVTIINVNRDGILDLDDLQTKLSQSGSKKKLVSVMLANNETGIIQPIAEISAIARQHGALIHSDCIQAIGKIAVSMEELDLDFVTISGHKFGGPVGAGALISKSSIHLQPIFIGGGQERGLRSGTENVPAIVGLGEAAEVSLSELSKRHDHMRDLRDQLEGALMEGFSCLEFVGRNSKRLPNTSLIINPQKAAETQLIAFDLKGVAVSSGSACSSGKVGKSHVLAAMGYSDEQIKSAIRVSVGYTNTINDINNFIRIYKELNR
ncbi:MAG: cysteine desulfurase family protein [Rickettsiaceae bacterium]